jgi:hypothetical protein
MSDRAADPLREGAHKPTAVQPRQSHSNSNSADVVASHHHHHRRLQTASLQSSSACKKKKTVRIRRHDSIVGQTRKQVNDAVTSWRSDVASTSQETRPDRQVSDRSIDQSSVTRRAVSVEDVDRRAVVESSVVAAVTRSSGDTLRRAYGLHRSSSSPDLNRDGRGCRDIRSGRGRTASRRRVDHDVYQSYLAGVLQSSHQSDRFIHLRRLYAIVERVSTVEDELQLVHATAGDSAAHRTESVGSDLSKRRRMHALIDELGQLYARLDEAYNNKEFFYLGYGDRLSKFRWNEVNDAGLTTRQLQLDELRAMYSASIRRDRFHNKVGYDRKWTNDSGIRQMPFKRLLTLFRKLDDKTRNEEMTRRLLQNQRQMRSQTSVNSSSSSSSCRLDGTYLRIMEEVAARSKERPMYGYHMYEYQHPYDKYVQSRRLSVPQSTTNFFDLQNDDESVTGEMRHVSDVSLPGTKSTDKCRPIKLTDKCVQDRENHESKSCGTSQADGSPDANIGDASIASEHWIVSGNGSTADCSPLIEEEKTLCQMAIDHSASSEVGKRSRGPKQHATVCQMPHDVIEFTGTESFLRRRSSYVTAINNNSKRDSNAAENVVENVNSCNNRSTSPHSFECDSAETTWKTCDGLNAVNRSERRPRLNIRAFRRQKEQWRRGSKPLPGTVSNVLTYLSSVNFDASCLNGQKAGHKTGHLMAPVLSEVAVIDENRSMSATDAMVDSSQDPSNSEQIIKTESRVEARNGRACKKSSADRRQEPVYADSDATRLFDRTPKHPMNAESEHVYRSCANALSPVDVKQDFFIRPETDSIRYKSDRKPSDKTNVGRRPSERKGSACNREVASACNGAELGDVSPPSDGADGRHCLQAVRPTYVSSVTYVARPMSVVSTRIEPKFVKSQCAAVRKLDRLSTVASVADRKPRAKTRRNGGISPPNKHKLDDVGNRGEQVTANANTIYLTLTPKEPVGRSRQRCDHDRIVSSSSPLGSSTLCKSRNRDKSAILRHSVESVSENVSMTCPTDDMKSATDVKSSVSSSTKPRIHHSNDERTVIAKETYFETSFGVDNHVELVSKTSAPSADNRQRRNSLTKNVARPRQPTSVSAASGLSSGRCSSTAAHEQIATSVDRRSPQAGKTVDAAASSSEVGGHRQGRHRIRRQDSLLMSAMMNSLETISGEWARDSDRQNTTSHDSIASSGTATEWTGALIMTSFVIGALLKDRQ